jgi:hypothetical protein
MVCKHQQASSGASSIAAVVVHWTLQQLGACWVDMPGMIMRLVLLLLLLEPATAPARSIQAHHAS